MIAEPETTVKYYLTRAQLQQALECAIDAQQEYLAEHSYDAAHARAAGINEVFEGLDADRELAADGEPLTLQLPDPADRVTELERRLGQLRATLSAGPYAFHFRHAALSWVRQHHPDVFSAAGDAACAVMNASGLLPYNDVVAGLEAQVAALRSAGHQAAQALHEVHDLLEQIPVVGNETAGRFQWWNETGPRAIAALEKAGVAR